MALPYAIPSTGDLIEFETVPAGSYASAGELYRVKVDGDGRRAFVHLTSMRGSGTFDRGAAYRFARFRVVGWRNAG